MLFKTYCATCNGINATTITIETDCSEGVGIRIVGLPDVAVKESLLRVTTALLGYGYRIPGRRILFNLAPADLRKEGSGYDLPMAVGLLAVSEQIYAPRCGEFIIMGELALDGKVRPVNGCLPIARHAGECGFKGCIFPRESALDAVDIDGIELYGVKTLGDVIDILSGDRDVSSLRMSPADRKVAPRTNCNDFKFVKGQLEARRGLEIAAAGGHSCILIGSPGSGKSMMASCLPSILPPMTREESIETSTIYSVSGNGTGEGLIKERPFRTPHHSASMVSLIGGGADAAPGEISLAHNGVLYLDEIAQFQKATLDAMRTPLEDGKVTISRARYKVTYPSSVMLIASMNPCPCGYWADGSSRCRCTPGQRAAYLSRLSGPFMDRLDLQIFCSPLKPGELTSDAPGEESAKIAARVLRARKLQQERFSGERIFCNAQMNAEMLKKFCLIGTEEKQYLEGILEKMKLSARAYSRILKLSRTIADLEGTPGISLKHIAEAVRFRSLDRNNLYE